MKNFDYRSSVFDTSRFAFTHEVKAIVKDIVNSHDELVESKVVKVIRPPLTSFDAVKSLLPTELQFGWLKPNYDQIEVTRQQTIKRTVQHYHVHPVNRDEDRLHWILPSYADLNRLGIYGVNGEEIHNCIRAAIDVMKCHNVAIKRLVMHPKDYDRLQIWIRKNYCFVDVTIDEFLDVSIVVSPIATLSFLEAE